MRRSIIILAGAAAALSAFASSAAVAQTADVTVDNGERRIVVHRTHAHRDPAEHLRAALQLRPNQEAALQAYIAAMHPQHEAFVWSSDQGEARTTPERLAQMEKHLAEAQGRAHARIEATRRFYDQLDPAQKRAFDEMPTLMIAVGGPMEMMDMVRMDMPLMPDVPPIPPAPRAPRAPKAPPVPRAPEVPPAPPSI